ncbi:hypothetical protein [Azospira oryzae]|nr:hypothetical protein [Azospira oryzae]
MLATEASTLVILMVAKELNNKKNLNYLSKKYSRNFSTKTEAKIFLINKLTKSKQKNYHTIAIKIKNILDERNSKYYIGKQKKFEISKKIYDPESKQRIYSLSLVLIAPLFALCINYGANIETIFELFNHDQKTTLIIIWLIPSFLLWLGALLLITLMEVISTTFQATKFMTKKHKAKSDLSMLVFYSDLIELSRPL